MDKQAGKGKVDSRTDKRAKDCIIWTMFDGHHKPIDEYCEKNCRYRCLVGREYKRVDGTYAPGTG